MTNNRYISNIKIILPVVFMAFVIGKILLRYAFPVNLGIFLMCILLIMSIIAFDYVVFLWIIVSAVGCLFRVDLPVISSIYPVEWMFLTFFSVWFVNKMVRKEMRIVTCRFDKYLLILLLWSVISLLVWLVTERNYDSFIIRISGLFLIILPVIIYMFTASYTREKGNIEKILVSIVLSFYLIAPINNYLTLTVGRKGMMESGIYYYLGGNFLGAYYAVIFMVCFSFAVYTIKKTTRFICIVTSLLSVLSVVILGSRTSQVALLISFFVVLLAYSRKWFLVILLCSTALISINYNSLFEYVNRRYGLHEVPGIINMQKGNSAWDRIPIAMDAIRIIGQNPLVGIGFDRYSSYSRYLSYNPMTKTLAPMASTHNDYLQIAVNVGLPGLAIFAIIVINILGTVVVGYMNAVNNMQKTCNLAMIGIITAFIIHSFASESILGSAGNYGFLLLSHRVYFWIMLGVVFGINTMKIDAQKNG